ncbi:MAG: hypothetical protein AB7G06_03480 [Bdellovibrionales bacterium]
MPEKKQQNLVVFVADGLYTGAVRFITLFGAIGTFAYEVATNFEGNFPATTRMLRRSEAGRFRPDAKSYSKPR